MVTCVREAKNFSLVPGTLVAAPRASSERDFRLEIRLPVYRDWLPGQFVMIRWGRHLVGRPFAIVDWRREDAGTSVLSLWIRRLGAGTEELFREALAGQAVDVTLPLGQPFEKSLFTAQRLLLVSGGVGAASLWPLAVARSKRGLRSLWLHGDRDLPSYDRELFQSTDRPDRVALEAGDVPGDFSRGRVTDLMREVMPEDLRSIEALVVCGPSPMLEAVSKTALSIPELAALPVHLGLEERMGCGVGLCFSCSVWTRAGMKRLCTEGPWFEAREIPGHFRLRKGAAV
ncbi:MAG: hypothetical protein JST16_13775 [Bdellovibrionales bacterium]|nr:hypothetical protein [Bdellovibrionales bacterium]